MTWIFVACIIMHDGDTIDIYVCDDTILDDVDPSEGQISQSLSQVIESFNAHGESLTAQPKKLNLLERLENDGVARVEHESDDDYSPIDLNDTEEEVKQHVQQ